MSPDRQWFMCVQCAPEKAIFWFGPFEADDHKDARLKVNTEARKTFPAQTLIISVQQGVGGVALHGQVYEVNEVL